GHEHQAARQLEVELGVGTEVAKRDRGDYQPASRIGMIRYRKSSLSPWSTAGRSGLINFSRTCSPVTDSTPSRRNSALNPISSASPPNETGSDSRASPTSWVCAEMVSSPSAKRSRS